MVTYKIGHSGITWGYDSSTAEAAVKDIAELGYSGYETMGGIIEDYERKYGKFDELLKRYNLPLVAYYVSVRFHNPTHWVSYRNEVLGWVRRARELGATTLVVQAGAREGKPYFHPIQWEGMAANITTLARAAAELGMITAIHPHTGTLVETAEEIDAIMNAVDPALVGFAPDTGQIQKGGADCLAVLKKYQDRIWHVHLKDFGGGKETGYAGYEPVGYGVLDMAAIFKILDSVNYDKWISVELDGTPQSPRSPREAAAMSKRYLTQLLGARTGWKA